MTAVPGRNAVHDTFRLERFYPVSPERLFLCMSDVNEKNQWFSGGGAWEKLAHEFDFKVGGREYLKGRWPNGTVSEFDSRYLDIVPNHRVINSYVMHIDGKKISATQGTLEIVPEGKGSRLVYTEQGVYLDGFEDGGGREEGTRQIYDRLAKYLGG